MHPDEHFSPETQLIVYGCSLPPEENRDRKEALLAQPLDWERICSLLNYHAIEGMFYKNIASCSNASRIPDAVLQKLLKCYHNTAYKNSVLLNEFITIAKRFNSENIKIMPLKGIDLIGRLYSNPGLRWMTDIDILVLKQDYDTASDTLEHIGYTQKHESPGKRSRHFHSIFWRQQRAVTVFTELHHDIDFIDSPYCISTEELWERAVPADENGIRIYRMAIEDSLLFNCLHIVRARNLKILSLRNFYDLREMLLRQREAISWDVLLERAERYRVERPLFLVLTVVNTLFSTDLPDRVLATGERHGLTRDMVQTVLRENIFLQGTTSIDLPQKMKELAGADTFAERLRIVRSMVSVFFSQFKSRFYSELRPSAVRAFIVICARHAGSLMRYCRACYHMIRYPRKTRRDIFLSSQLQSEKTTVSKWLRSKQ